MKVQIIGTGVVGEATACLAQYLGHDVYGYDIKPHNSQYYKVVPEPLKNVDITFICINEMQVVKVVEELKNASVNGLIVIRSSVIPDTTRLLNSKLYHICHNPEFLDAHNAIYDTFNPSRIVIGECCKEHGDILEDYYSQLKKPIIRTTPTESELIKFASNCWFATVVSYWNVIESIANKYGLKGAEIGAVASMDTRISQHGARFHHKYDGKCLPKDMKHLIDIGKTVGCNVSMIEAIDKYNESLK